MSATIFDLYREVKTLVEKTHVFQDETERQQWLNEIIPILSAEKLAQVKETLEHAVEAKTEAEKQYVAELKVKIEKLKAISMRVVRMVHDNEEAATRTHDEAVVAALEDEIAKM